MISLVVTSAIIGACLYNSLLYLLLWRNNRDDHMRLSFGLATLFYPFISIGTLIIQHAQTPSTAALGFKIQLGFNLIALPLFAWVIFEYASISQKIYLKIYGIFALILFLLNGFLPGSLIYQAITLRSSELTYSVRWWSLSLLYIFNAIFFASLLTASIILLKRGDRRRAAPLLIIFCLYIVAAIVATLSDLNILPHIYIDHYVSIFFIIVMSITLTHTYRNAVARLKHSEQRYRALFEGSHDAMIIMSQPDWHYISGNSAAQKLYGANSQEELLNVTPRQLSPRFQPDGSPSDIKAQEMINHALHKGSHFFEWQCCRMNGNEFPATVLLNRINQDGDVLIQSTIRDISHEKTLEKRLRQSEKMEAIGQLAGGIAHDFNNILSGIVGYSDLLLSIIPPHSNEHGYIQKILSASNRATALVRQILSFSRQEESKMSPMLLRPVVKEAIALLRASLPSSIIIDERLVSEKNPVLANSTKIQETCPMPRQTTKQFLEIPRACPGQFH